MRGLRCLVLIVVMMGWAGCAARPMPGMQEYPGTVLGVAVRDADTGAPLRRARVEFLVAESAEPSRAEPFVTMPRGPVPSSAARPPLPLAQRPGGGDGVFRFESRRALTLPLLHRLPEPLGAAMPHERHAHVRVAALGYREAEFFYRAEKPPHPGRRYNCPTSAASVVLEDDGLLVFYLPRRGPSPTSYRSAQRP